MSEACRLRVIGLAQNAIPWYSIFRSHPFRLQVDAIVCIATFGVFTLVTGAVCYKMYPLEYSSESLSYCTAWYARQQVGGTAARPG